MSFNFCRCCPHQSGAFLKYTIGSSRIPLSDAYSWGIDIVYISQVHFSNAASAPAVSPMQMHLDGVQTFTSHFSTNTPVGSSVYIYTYVRTHPYITLHYITLHYITLHYITYIHTLVRCISTRRTSFTEASRCGIDVYISHVSFLSTAPVLTRSAVQMHLDGVRCVHRPCPFIKYSLHQQNLLERLI